MNCPKLLDETFDFINSRYGQIFVSKKPDIISNFLREYGEWAFLEIEFLASILGDINAVYDIGSHLGTFSLGIRQLLDFDKLIAAEANPFCWDALQSNLAKFKDDTQIVRGAIGLKQQTFADLLSFYEEGNLGSLSFCDKTNKNCKVNTVKINVYTLAQLRQSYGPADFIKLDIEGMELAALQSDQKWLINEKPFIWAECNNDMHTLKLLKFFIWAGFEVYYFAYPAYNPKNFNNSNNVIYPFAYEAGLLSGVFDSPQALDEKLAAKGCIFRKIESPSDLKQSLWLTPRWGDRKWLDMGKYELVAFLSHVVKNEKFEEFLID